MDNNSERFYLRLATTMRDNRVDFEVREDGRLRYDNERGRDIIQRKLVLGPEVMSALRNLVRESGMREREREKQSEAKKTQNAFCHRHNG
jgi:hypothetical protein